MKYKEKKLCIGASFSQLFLESQLVLTCRKRQAPSLITISKRSTTKYLKQVRGNSTKICQFCYDATFIKSNFTLISLFLINNLRPIQTLHKVSTVTFRNFPTSQMFCNEGRYKIASWDTESNTNVMLYAIWYHLYNLKT